MTHTVYAMQMILRLCDKFADDFHIRFHRGKSVAVKRFNEKCLSLQLDRKDISYVNELKYLGVYVIAGQHLRFFVEHFRSKFYCTFNCIYSKSKVSSSEIITVVLLKSY